SIYCFYMTEALPSRASGYDFERGEVVRMTPPRQNTHTFSRLRSLAIDAFERAGYRVFAPHHQSLWHPVGTVRFGNDSQTSVLDRNCKVHNVDNLYVVDASVLPSAGAVNTGLTIAALALRVGDTIAGSIPKAVAGRQAGDLEVRQGSGAHLSAQFSAHRIGHD